MDANDLIFLGLKSRVSALTKSDGRILWATVLRGGVGDGFVTLNCDGKFVYAHTKGRIFCLDFLSGQLLWTNELTGYGYGIASICLAGFTTAPYPAIYAQIASERQAAANASA